MMENKPVTISSREILEVFKEKLNKIVPISLNQIFGPNAETKISSEGGIYLFWWTGPSRTFTKQARLHRHLIKGKQTENEKINIRFSPEWIGEATKKNGICLYAGKTSCLKKRIASHIKPKTENIWGDKKHTSDKKPNTVSQMRIGIEKIFQTYEGLDLILKNVSISYIEMNDVENCVNRFYLENSIIGDYFPLLNVDVER